jgi:hypothetical protein
VHGKGSILDFDFGLAAALAMRDVVDGVEREARVVALARESLFLDSGDDLAVANRCPRGVMLERRDPQPENRSLPEDNMIERLLDRRRVPAGIPQEIQSPRGLP